jgi:hypothetical protein
MKHHTRKIASISMKEVECELREESIIVAGDCLEDLNHCPLCGEVIKND